MFVSLPCSVDNDSGQPLLVYWASTRDLRGPEQDWKLWARRSGQRKREVVKVGLYTKSQLLPRQDPVIQNGYRDLAAPARACATVHLSDAMDPPAAASCQVQL